MLDRPTPSSISVTQNPATSHDPGPTAPVPGGGITSDPAGGTVSLGPGPLLPVYSRVPFHPRSGRGALLFDAEGKARWDLLSGIGVNALGHNHARLRRVLQEEASGLLHVSNLYDHPSQDRLAERLVRLSGLSRVFFCNSGTEAVEAALKFARLGNPGRPGVVALEESFHGRTMGALSVTGHAAYRRPFAPLVPGASFVPPNDTKALAGAVTGETAAILLEPVLGEGGVIPLTADFLREARREADRSGALLILDEIQCGLGRTGSIFAFQEAGILPDLLTLAKPLGGGLPLGAVVTGPALDGVVRPGQHGSTFGGNPLACALGLAFLDELAERHLVERAAALGAWLGPRLYKLAERFPEIFEIRGRGLMWGIELTREAAPVAAALLERGFLVGTARGTVLRLLPPYIVPRKALTAFLHALEAALEETRLPATGRPADATPSQADHQRPPKEIPA